MSTDYTQPITMIDGTEVYFSVVKSEWHWCVYKYTKKPESFGWSKDFYEWYFMKYFAERRAERMYHHYQKMNAKMKREESYNRHLQAILEKEDDGKL